MFSNYIKTAIRSLLRHRFSSAINVFGLAVAMALSMIIIMLVADQMMYDRYNSKRDRIYRINSIPTSRNGGDGMETATTTLPLHADDLSEFGGDKAECVNGMIQRTVERMYTESEENRFLEVTYANGDKEVLYFKDFNSGAMIQNIVDRAKKMAIKEFLSSARKGMRLQHLLDSCVDEFRENEDLPNTTNPDDWARISGKKGERIVYIRTLISGKQGTEAGRSIDTVANTGQYL